MDWLQHSGYEFNTYAECGQRRKSYLLRGLALGSDEDNHVLIRDEFERVGVNGEVIVSRFLTGHMKRNCDVNAPLIYMNLRRGIFLD